MSDPRVVRGSVTRSLKAGPSTTKTIKSSTVNPAKQKTNNINTNIDTSDRSNRPSYVYHVSELVKPEIDLSKYITEREPENKKPPKIAETQTDIFQTRPDTPEYVPRKTGVDVETQVEDVRDLFRFDEEVESLLNVICAKTLEQALFEVQREAELVNLHDECNRFEEIRVQEQHWLKAKELQTVAESYTKDLALKALKAEQGSQWVVRAKVAGLEAARQMLPAMLDEICDELYTSGEWKDPQQHDIDTVYLSDVTQAACSNIDLFNKAQMLVDEILLLAFEGRELFSVSEFDKKSVIKLMVPGSLVGVDTSDNVTVGFVAIQGSDSVFSINNKIKAKLADEGLKLDKEVNLHAYLAELMGVRPEDLLKSAVLDTSKLPEIMNIVLPLE